MGKKCQYLAKKANFGPNLAVHEHKILIFMGVSKSFGTHIKENHLGNLFELFFGQALDQMGQKGRYLAKNVTFGILISGNQWDTFSVLKTLTGDAQIGR